MNGRYIRKMRTQEKVVGIKHPLNFIASVGKCAEELGLDIEDGEAFDWLDAIEKLSFLDKSFSEEVRGYLNPKLI